MSNATIQEQKELIAKQQAKLDDLEAERKKLSARVKKEKAALESIIKEQEKAFEDHKKQLKSMTGEAEAKISEVKARESGINELLRKLEREKAEALTAHNQQMAQLQTTKKDVEAGFQDLVHRQQQYSANVKAFQEREKALIRREQEAQKKENDLIVHQQNVEAKIEDLKDHQAQLTNTLAAQKQVVLECNKAREDMEQLKQQLDESRQKHEEARRNAVVAQDKVQAVENAKKEYDALAEELRVTKDNLMLREKSMIQHQQNLDLWEKQLKEKETALRAGR